MDGCEEYCGSGLVVICESQGPAILFYCLSVNLVCVTAGPRALYIPFQFLPYPFESAYLFLLAFGSGRNYDYKRSEKIGCLKEGNQLFPIECFSLINIFS